MTAQTWAIANAGTILLIAQIALVWMVVNYALPELHNARRGMAKLNRAAWVRLSVTSVIAAGVCFWLARFEIAIAAVVLAGCVAVPWLRTKISAAYAAEFEIAANVAVVCVIAFLVRTMGLLPHHLGRIADNHGAAVLIIGAMILFTVRGGTYIVRGILDKVGTLPPLDGRGDAIFEIDMKEYNRGRLIGNIERVLLVVMAAVHSYEALGFLIAAKGLIRSRDLENRSWAEYFLVGTLASTLVALVMGLGMQWVIKSLW